MKENGKFVMLYRAQDSKGTSSLGYATSDDGIHFERRPEPVMAAEAPYEKGGGVEPSQYDVAGARRILGDFGKLNAGLTLKDAAF